MGLCVEKRGTPNWWTDGYFSAKNDQWIWRQPVGQIQMHESWWGFGQCGWYRCGIRIGHPKMRSFHKQKPCTWVSSQVTFIRNVLEEVGVGVYSFQKWLLHTQAYNITNTRKKLCKPSSCFIWEARLSKNGLPLRSNGSSSFSWWKRSILAYTLFWTKQYKDLRSLPIDWSSSESIEFPEYPMFTIFGYVPY